jgi:hypothetical protein
MASSANQPFLAAIQLFVDSSKQEMDEVVRRTGIKILGRWWKCLRSGSQTLAGEPDGISLQHCRA